MLSRLKYHPCSNHIMHIPVPNCHKVWKWMRRITNCLSIKLILQAWGVRVCFFLLIHMVCSEEIRWASMPFQASWDGKKASVNFGQGQKFINKHELNWKRQSYGLKAIESIHVCCESGLGGVCRFSHVSKTWPYFSSFLARSSKWVNIKIPLCQ